MNMLQYVYPIFCFISFLTLISLASSDQCFDTKYLKTKYTALRRPDYEILDVTREEYCKTHCSGNSSCAAFVYNAETSTCVLSGEPDVILNDYKTDVKNVTVKKRFYSELLIQDQGVECDEAMQFLNAHQYWNGPTADGMDEGTIWSVTYSKSRDDTDLRIIQHHTIRGHKNAQTEACVHWYMTFNGNKCTNPGTIEQLDFSETSSNAHRGSDVDGICSGLSSGDVLVETLVGPCEGYPVTDSYTGYNAPRSTLIMEVVPPAAVKINAATECPPAISFNYNSYSWDEVVDYTFDTSAESKLVKSILYTKTASDTGLRIKYNALLSLNMPGVREKYCGRWYLAINGTECNPKTDIIIGCRSGYEWWVDHKRVRSIEGICGTDLEAGVYRIEVMVGPCLIHPSEIEPINFISGGLNVPSRLHVNEVRTDIAMAAKFRFSINMYAKIQYWHWDQLNDDTDVGEILAVNYNKAFQYTGLRLTASGDHRIVYRPGNNNAQCGRWYFKINEQECNNPGSISSIIHFNQESNKHDPMQTSGVCHGLAAGSLSIKYAVGLCPSQSQHTDAYTGWQSSFYIIAEEIRLQNVKECTTATPVNCDSN